MLQDDRETLLKHAYHEFEFSDGDNDHGATDEPSPQSNTQKFDLDIDNAYDKDEFTNENDGPPTGMRWSSAAFIMVATLVGIGVLGISEALASLGWGVGLTVLFLFAIASTYSGFMISRAMLYIETLKIHGRPRKYGALGFAAYGTRGETIIRRTQMLYLAGIIVSYQKVAASCLHQVVVQLGGGFCLVSSQLVVALVMLGAMQIQTLEGVTYIATFGVAMIVVTISIYLQQVVDGGLESPDVGGPGNFWTSIDAVMVIAFAFQGQSIFPEIQSEMKTRTDMPKAVVAAGITMLVIYTGVGSVGYSFVGRAAPFLYKWDIQRNGAQVKTTIANAFLVLHILTGYTISSNVLNQGAVEWVMKGKKPTRLQWLSVTSVTALSAFVLGNVIPQVPNIIALIGAACGNVLTFLAPIAVLIALVGDEMSERILMLHKAMFVFWLVVTVVGTVVAAKTLIESLADSKAPFQC
eukprot:m.108134 g.108134  ORF g.108134 m.108134 type:complete len:466 (+) comp27849_c1_seq3:199-1596(+)